MSLYRREGSPYWQYDFTVNGVRLRGSTGETGKREALKVEDDHKQSARREQGARKKEWTVQMWCEAYWDDHAQHRPSHPTILGQLAALRRHLGKDRKLSSLTNSAMLDYRAKRRGDGLAQHSINREITIARAAMRHVAEVHGVNVPKLHWEKLKTEEPPPRQHYLTFDEWAILLAGAHASIKPILICAATTGLRKGNILTLDWRQVRLDARRIAITVKGNKIHEVRIVPLLSAALSAMPERAGRVFDGTNFEKRWRAAVKAAKLVDFRFHDLRHTFASWARQSGADIADVKDALGHSDISMTMRYAHIRPDAENTAFDRVSAALAAHSTPQSLRKRRK
jgi:integrase